MVRKPRGSFRQRKQHRGSWQGSDLGTMSLCTKSMRLFSLPGSFKQNVFVPFGRSKESTVSLRDSSEKNYKETMKIIHTKQVFL